MWMPWLDLEGEGAIIGLMSKDRFVVIMAGGRGERFWPQSRLKKPKQLLPIVGDKALLTQAVERVGKLVPPERVFILTNSEQREAVLEACPMVPPEQVVGEPVGRDTAACVGLAATLIDMQAQGAVFAVLPADHVIHDTAKFCEVLDCAFAAAEAEPVIATVGIKPTHAATGYGYIQRGDACGEHAGQSVYSVKRFVEKPDAATAQSYLDSGDYYWNAGMFIWRSETVLSGFAAHVPEQFELLTKLKNDTADGRPLDEALAEYYPQMPKISIDYALIEKADNVVTVESTFDWDDVGEWPAIERHDKADSSGNVARGEVAFHEASNNIVLSSGKHLTAVLGCEDLIVVHTDDATLVCPKDRAQDIKKLVQSISKNTDWQHLI